MDTNWWQKFQKDFSTFRTDLIVDHGWNDLTCHYNLECLLHQETVIPTTNQYAKQQGPMWTDLDFDDFLHELGLLLPMEVYETHVPCRLYWYPEMTDLFPSMNFEKVTNYKRFEKTMMYMPLSNTS